MNKKITNTIKLANKLHSKGLIYFENNPKIDMEPNYQFLSMLIEDLELLIDVEKYELLKGDKQILAHYLADLNCFNNKVFFNIGIDFTTKLILEYVDLEDAILIGQNYVFTEKFNRLNYVYNKAWVQINENKFLNIIF